jgi:hypothetical protein
MQVAHSRFEFKPQQMQSLLLFLVTLFSRALSYSHPLLPFPINAFICIILYIYDHFKTNTLKIVLDLRFLFVCGSGNYFLEFEGTSGGPCREYILS